MATAALGAKLGGHPPIDVQLAGIGVPARKEHSPLCDLIIPSTIESAPEEKNTNEEDVKESQRRSLHIDATKHLPWLNFQSCWG